MTFLSFPSSTFLLICLHLPSPKQSEPQHAFLDARPGPGGHARPIRDADVLPQRLSFRAPACACGDESRKASNYGTAQSGEASTAACAAWPEWMPVRD